MNDRSVFDIGIAREARDKHRKLVRFLNCDINNENVKDFVSTLINNRMLYYFDEDAHDVKDESENLIFSNKQAMMLNLIRNRFKENPNIYNSLFSEAESSIGLEQAN